MRTLILLIILALPALGQVPFKLPEPGMGGQRSSPTLDDIRDSCEKFLSKDEALPRPNPTLEVIAAKLATPDAAFEFVRDRIALQAYPGAMRGPELVIAAGAGNPLDRSALLGAILQLQGHKVRYSRGKLPEEHVQKAFERVTHAPVTSRVAENPFLDAIRNRAGAAFKPLREAALEQAAAMMRPDEFNAPAYEDLREHWWVEMEKEGEWIAMDPLLGDLSQGATRADAEETFETIPADQLQRIRVTVTAEIASDKEIRRQVALTHEETVERFSTSIVTLSRGDNGYGDAVSKKFSQLLGTGSYQPCLVIGQEVQKGETVRFGLNDSKEGSSGGLLGDLTFDDSGESSVKAADQLVGLILEISCHAPGGRQIVSRRLLYDRIPPADRLAWESADHPVEVDFAFASEVPGSLARALNGYHFIHAYHGAHNPGQLLAQNLGMLSAINERYAASPDPAAETLAADSFRNLTASSWRALAVANDDLVTPSVNDLDGLRFYPAHPRIALISMVHPKDDPRLSVSVDLLQDDLRIACADDISAEEIAVRQLWRGALSGALETEMLNLSLASFLTDAEGSSESATSLDTLMIVRDMEADTAGIALKKALSSGKLVLAAPEEQGRNCFWEISDSTGATKAMLEPGLGGTSYVVNPLGTLNGPNVHIVNLKDFSSRRVSDVTFNRVKATPRPSGTITQYIEMIEVSTANCVPAALAFGMTTGNCMLLGAISFNEGVLHGRDWTQMFF